MTLLIHMPRKLAEDAQNAQLVKDFPYNVAVE